MRNPVKHARLACAVPVLFLFGCGGSSGGDGSTSPPAGNSPPTISGTAPQTAISGQAWAFQPSASDPDGDALSFSVDNRPSWAGFDSSTGRLSGTPSDSDVRRWEGIRISVSDGRAQAQLSPFAIDVRAAGTSFGTATLSWSPPTERADGSPIGELAGFRVVYGTQSGRYEYSVRIDNPGLTRYVVEDLYPATWYFAVTAITTDGLESPPSREVSKRIEG